MTVFSSSKGQAESGKSTVLKNFQLRFSPKAFEAEVFKKISAEYFQTQLIQHCRQRSGAL